MFCLLVFVSKANASYQGSPQLLIIFTMHLLIVKEQIVSIENSFYGRELSYSLTGCKTLFKDFP